MPRDRPTSPLEWGSPALGWPADPFRGYGAARARGPVTRATLRSGREVWLVTGFAEAKAALADPRLSTDGRRFYRRWWGATTGGPPAPEGATGGGTADVSFEAAPDGGGELDVSLAEHMLSTDPPDHTRLRRLVSQAFTLSRVESLRPRVVEIATGLVDALEGRTHADLIADVAFPLPVRVICELLGVPVEDEAVFRRFIRAMLSFGTTEATRQASQAAALDAAGYLSELLAAKRREPADDLISGLVAARDGDQVLSEVELMSMVFLLLLAGHETTVNLIGNGMAALLRDTGQLALLQARPGLVGAAVEELLRFDGPVHHPTLRFTLEEVLLGRVTIPAGQIVLVALGAANRDPARFGEPDRIDVTRDDGQHLAFGHGPHFCLGAPLARLEGRVALSLLVERFPRLALDVPHEALSWREGIFLRGLEALPVSL
jgi:cytochrome P450